MLLRLPSHSSEPCNESRTGPGLFLEFSRPFTLVAPALGFASGAATAAGAAPRESWSPDLLLYPIIGLTMAAVLNAASNALNQIYDLDIDRVNKPKRPLPSGRLSRKDAWMFTLAAYAIALVLAWFVQPAGRHECFWIVVAATIITVLYSAPPFRTKRLGIWANVTIAIPRGVLLKVAGWSAVKTIMGTEPWYIGAIFGLFLLGLPRPRISRTWKETRAADAARCRSSTAFVVPPG